MPSSWHYYDAFDDDNAMIISRHDKHKMSLNNHNLIMVSMKYHVHAMTACLSCLTMDVNPGVLKRWWKHLMSLDFISFEIELRVRANGAHFAPKFFESFSDMDFNEQNMMCYDATKLLFSSV